MDKSMSRRDWLRRAARYATGVALAGGAFWLVRRDASCGESACVCEQCQWASICQTNRSNENQPIRR